MFQQTTLVTVTLSFVRNVRCCPVARYSAVHTLSVAQCVTLSAGDTMIVFNRCRQDTAVRPRTEVQRVLVRV